MLGARVHRPTGWEVPIAIVGPLSSRTFVDEWIVRRERIDVPPRRFWAWTMAMRPWESYLAQILQFQCQLPSALAGHGGDATATDPCAVRVDALEDAAKVFDELEVAYAGDIEIPIARTKLQAAHLQLKKVIASASAPSQRILIDGGIVELPPAGYLPVTPGVEPSVQEQVRRLLGPGVDLRFCATTADFVAHALEEAQHMERISLLHGLDNPNDKPKVDILVPDGAVAAAPPRQALGWDTQIGVSGTLFGSARSQRERQRTCRCASGAVQGEVRRGPTDRSSSRSPASSRPVLRHCAHGDNVRRGTRGGRGRDTQRGRGSRRWNDAATDRGVRERAVQPQPVRAERRRNVHHRGRRCRRCGARRGQGGRYRHRAQQLRREVTGATRSGRSARDRGRHALR